MDHIFYCLLLPSARILLPLLPCLYAGRTQWRSAERSLWVTSVTAGGVPLDLPTPGRPLRTLFLVRQAEDRAVHDALGRRRDGVAAEGAVGLGGDARRAGGTDARRDGGRRRSIEGRR